MIKILLKRNPSNWQLVAIIIRAKNKEEYWTQLLKQSPTINQLMYIIENIEKNDEAIEAIEKLFQNSKMIDVIEQRKKYYEIISKKCKT